MDKMPAVYVADLIERLLREDSGVFAEARKEFALSHGTFGLRQLLAGERALRTTYQIPDSKGVIEVEE